MKGYRKLLTDLKYHAVDSTALLASTHPIWAAIETFAAGMSIDVSLKTRLFMTGVAYSGFGYFYGKGRDLSRKLFHISDKTAEKVQIFHDAAYTITFTAALSPPVYLFMGESDISKIAIGTGIGAALGALKGPWVGYAIDTSRDLMGLETCERKTYSKFVRQLKPKAKKALAGGLVATSIAATWLVYSLNSDTRATPQYDISAEQRLLSMTDDRSADKYLAHFLRD